MPFQIKFGKKSVADFSKECAFLLPQRKIHFALISFSGSVEVAAGLSNLESTTAPSAPSPLIKWGFNKEYWGSSPSVIS